MANSLRKYTDEKALECIALFNRTELRPNEEVINNTDKQIALETGLKVQTVSNIISKYLKNKTND